MQIRTRQDLLLLLVGAAVGLLLLDSLVLEPALKRWSAQGERIDELRKKVTQGKQLMVREKIIRERWAEMQQNDLDPEVSEAAARAYGGIQKWAAASSVVTTNLNPNWRSPDDEYNLYEFRASLTGTQASLGQFIYGLETDTLPVRLEECDLTARDAKGQQLTGALRFSFLRLKEGRARP